MHNGSWLETHLDKRTFKQWHITYGFYDKRLLQGRDGGLSLSIVFFLC